MKLIIAWDFILSFMWPWGASLTKLFVHSFLGFGPTSEAQILRYSLFVSFIYLFAFLKKASNGGAHNPLSLLNFSHGTHGFLFVVLVRIPAQVAGSITGVQLIERAFPELGHGSRLRVGIHHGALVEGFLSFAVVMFNLMLAKANLKSFIMKTWISTICKMSIHLLGADLTGGIMNPASALGWAYARGDYITREHVLVYWIAPIQATALALWTFKLFAEQKTTKRALLAPAAQKAKAE